MGQQQLLLIVLGVIIVGIAIVVGINLFNANAVSSNRDAVISDLNNLGALATQFYMKPVSMGGGGNTFTGWTIPATLDSTANGTYNSPAPTITATTVTIVGKGTQKVGGTAVQATATVTSTGTTIVVNN